MSGVSFMLSFTLTMLLSSSSGHYSLKGSYVIKKKTVLEFKISGDVSMITSY